MAPPTLWAHLESTFAQCSTYYSRSHFFLKKNPHLLAYVHYL